MRPAERFILAQPAQLIFGLSQKYCDSVNFVLDISQNIGIILHTLKLRISDAPNKWYLNSSGFRYGANRILYSWLVNF